MAMAMRSTTRSLARRWMPASGRDMRFFSTSQVQTDTELEHGKMVNEGGGSHSSFEEAKEDKSSSTLNKVVEGVKHQAEVEMKTAKDMLKGSPEKTQATKEDLKETVVIAGQAVKRDVEKLAEKVGLRESKPGNLENE